VYVLRGRDDHTYGRGALLGWRRFSALPLRMVELPGGRWLLDGAAEHLADRVRAELLAAAAVPAAAVPG
jgi:surfactin synthase thioesterase subunit